MTSNVGPRFFAGLRLCYRKDAARNSAHITLETMLLQIGYRRELACCRQTRADGHRHAGLGPHAGWHDGGLHVVHWLNLRGAIHENRSLVFESRSRSFLALIRVYWPHFRCATKAFVGSGLGSVGFALKARCFS